MGNLARYIIRASFSQESPPWCDPFAFLKFTLQTNPDLAFQVYRLVIGLGQGVTYISDESKVIYRSKKENTLDAMECLAVMFSHVPGKEE